jgi:hypothetical protein
MTETGGKFGRNVIAVGVLAAMLCAGGAFAVLHRHPHTGENARPAVTRPSLTTTRPATTRAIVKHKKKHK